MNDTNIDSSPSNSAGGVQVTEDDIGKSVVTEGGQDIGVAVAEGEETLDINVSKINGRGTNPYSISTHVIKTITDTEIILYES